MSNKSVIVSTVLTILLIGALLTGTTYSQDEDQTRNVLKQGLLGAGTGAIAAGASGGKAGQGALIGAGTAVIGSALLDVLTTPSRPQRRSAPVQDEDYYTDDSEAYYEEPPPQESGSTKILKQGLIGAGTGAIAAGASGGKAGQGALIGAGTAVVGGAILDTLTQPPQQKRGKVYRKVPKQKVQNVQVQEETAGSEGGRKKVVKKYDENGKLVSEEEIYY